MVYILISQYLWSRVRGRTVQTIFSKKIVLLPCFVILQNLISSVQLQKLLVSVIFIILVWMIFKSKFLESFSNISIVSIFTDSQEIIEVLTDH